jgi:hypothetical protein
MPDIIPLPPDYAAWLDELKTRIHAAQQKAVLAVNRELVLLHESHAKPRSHEDNAESFACFAASRAAISCWMESEFVQAAPAQLSFSANCPANCWTIESQQ